MPEKLYTQVMTAPGHGNYNGRDADEVQLPRQEVVILPVAVFLQQLAGGGAVRGTQAVLEHRGGQ